MDDKLNSVIACYEDEELKLLQLIKNYIKEGEYQLAHFHQEALYQLSRRLQTLKSFDDILYNEKSSKKDMVGYLERLMAEQPEYMQEYLSKELSEQKEELNILNRKPKQPVTSENTSVLDKALINLVERKIKSFKLILRKRDNLFLEFSYRNKILKVIFPFIKQHVRKDVLYNYNINSLKGLGFNLSDNGSKLVLKVTGNKEEAISELKIILSKIVFEIFYFKEFENESYIEIIDKVN